MFRRLPEFSGINVNGIRIDFMALTKSAILSSDLTTFETIGYFFRVKGKNSSKVSVTCTIYFSRDYIFSGDNLSKIAADFYERELKKIPEFMKEENGAIKKYLKQIANSIKIFLENEKLLKNNSDGGGNKVKGTKIVKGGRKSGKKSPKKKK